MGHRACRRFISIASLGTGMQDGESDVYTQIPTSNCTASQVPGAISVTAVDEHHGMWELRLAGHNAGTKWRSSGRGTARGLSGDQVGWARRGD